MEIELLPKRFQIDMGYILSVFFFITLSPRLSVLIDGLQLGIEDRILNKALWVFTYICCLAVLIIVCYLKRIDVKKAAIDIIKRYRELLIALSILLVGLSVSIIASANIEQSLIGLGYYAAIISIVPFSLLVFYIFPNSRNEFIKGLFVSAGILIIIGFIQYIDYRVNQDYGWFVSLLNPSGLALVESFNIRTSESGLFLRPSSLMVDTNIFAVFMAIVSLLALDLWGKTRNYLAVFVGTLSVVALFSTFSRTGLIVLIIGLLGYSIMNWASRGGRWGKLYSASPFGIMIARLGLNDYSAMEHLNYWLESLKIFLKYPLFGIGIANFPYYYKEFIDSKVAFATPHSVYAKLLSETGLVGFLPFVIAIIGFARAILVNRSSIYIALFVALVAGNITYDFFLTPWVWLLLGLFVARDGKIA